MIALRATLLAFFALHQTALALPNYATIEFAFSADISEVASRALLAQVQLGIPTNERFLMVDVDSDRVELDSCFRRESYTYGEVSNTDFLVLPEERITDVAARAIFRLPVRDHCTDVGALPSRFYENCIGRRCQGMLGLAPSSPLWDFWSRYSLTLHGMHIGANHPRAPSSFPREETVNCLPYGGGVCTYLLGDDITTVQFHLHNSYIYVPERVYASLLSGELRQLSLGPLTITEQMLWHTPGGLLDHTSTSTSLFFSQHAPRTRTPLFKSWSNATAISIGNTVLRDYELHVDLARNRMRVERSPRREHFDILGAWLSLALVFLWARSVTLSFNELGWLSLGVPVQCGCGRLEPHAHSGDVTHWVASALSFAGSIVALLYATPYLLFEWSHVALVIAWFVNFCGFALFFVDGERSRRRMCRQHEYGVRVPYGSVAACAMILESLLALSVSLVCIPVHTTAPTSWLSAVTVCVFCFNTFRHAVHWFNRRKFSVPMLCELLLVGWCYCGVVMEHVLSIPICCIVAVGSAWLAQVSVSLNARSRIQFLLTRTATK